MSARELVLWDGQCGFCRRCVAWMERHDKHGRYTAVPYQQAESPPMTPELAEACSTAVHLVRRDGTLLKGGRAVLAVLGGLGVPLMGVAALPPFIWVIEVGYRLVARNRVAFSRWFFPCEDGGALVGRRAKGGCGGG